MAFGLTTVARLTVAAITVAAVLATGAAATPGDSARTPELEFLGQQIFPTSTQFQGTSFGGLSGFAYDESRAVFYALSDDQVGARFYTLRIGVGGGAPATRCSRGWGGGVGSRRDGGGQASPSSCSGGAPARRAARSTNETFDSSSARRPPSSRNMRSTRVRSPALS